MALRHACCALFVAAGCAPAATQEAKPIPPTPLADHHKHVPSPAAAAYARAAGRADLVGDVQSITAEQLVAELDAAGIRQGVVLSVAYWFGSRNLGRVDNEYAKVRAENDWTTQQARRFPARLVPFCSVNPLKDYAREEINRCATQLMVKGLKLHFNGSGVDLQSLRHADTIRRVFQTVNERRLAMVVHVRGDLAVYGREHAEKFLDLLSAAPDVPVQVAHLWGGEGFSEAPLAIYASAVSSGDARTKNLYFDVADIARFVVRSEAARRMAVRHIRAIGPDRILWGSDMAPPGPPAQQAWTAFRTTLSLTENEMRTIATNVAPYLR
jgi:predicted TIM-barrel fold metal-dependent hydrolase